MAAVARRLHAAWKAGRLGGEVMPEDAHPAMPAGSEALARYFTLGMALNYQRDSYALWRACTALHQAAPWAFEPDAVAASDPAALTDVLVRHRVALQPNRHPAIWRRVAQGLVRHADGRVRTLFERNGDDIARILAFLAARKADFPYLCGPKIAHYWLYVMSSRMGWPIVGRGALSVAPDRHVIAGSIQLGLIARDEVPPGALAAYVAER